MRNKNPLILKIDELLYLYSKTDSGISFVQYTNLYKYYPNAARVH